MFNFDRNIANEIFIKMMSTRNCVVAETITSDNFCFILNLLEHIGFHTNDIRTYDINIIVHKTSNYKNVKNYIILSYEYLSWFYGMLKIT